MGTATENYQKDIAEIKDSLAFIKNILAEEFELTDKVKKQLELANKTPLSEYIDHEDVKKRLLR